MKKIVTALASMLLMTPAFLQAAENAGLDQFASLNPAAGAVSLDIHESGLLSFNFAFKDGVGDVARDKDLFITCKRNGNVISNVPASNTALIKYDNIYASVWTVSFFSSPNFECTAGGDYEVTIPEGFFLLGDSKTPNAEIIINYTIDVPAVEVFPKPGRDFAMLQDFTFTFGDAKTVEANPDAEHSVEVFDLFGGEPDEPGTGDDDDDETVDPGTFEGLPYELIFDGNSMTIHLLEAVTKGSTYNVSVPAGALNLIDEDGNITNNGELFYQYAIPKVGKGRPELTNVSSIALDFPGVIEMQLPEGESVFLINQMGANYLYPINEDGTRGEKIAAYRAASKASSYYKDDKGNIIAENANKVFLINELGNDVHIAPAPGLYALVTSDALYTVKNSEGGYTSVSSFSYTVEIVDGDLYGAEFTPANGSTVYNLDEIKVTFPYAEEVKVEWGTSWLRSATTSYQFFPQGTVDNCNTVVFKTSVPVTMVGDYRFTSNLGSIQVDGDFVGVVADYTVNEFSGVKEVANVTVLPEKFDIFNAQGIVIMRNANVNDLNSLPAGIYIAGGKKIVNRW